LTLSRPSTPMDPARRFEVGSSTITEFALTAIASS
jgi:hypothetical protein